MQPYAMLNRPCPPRLTCAICPDSPSNTILVSCPAPPMSVNTRSSLEPASPTGAAVPATIFALSRVRKWMRKAARSLAVGAATFRQATSGPASLAPFTAPPAPSPGLPSFPTRHAAFVLPLADASPPPRPYQVACSSALTFEVPNAASRRTPPPSLAPAGKSPSRRQHLPVARTSPRQTRPGTPLRVDLLLVLLLACSLLEALPTARPFGMALIGPKTSILLGSVNTTVYPYSIILSESNDEFALTDPDTPPNERNERETVGYRQVSLRANHVTFSLQKVKDCFDLRSTEAKRAENFKVACATRCGKFFRDDPEVNCEPGYLSSGPVQRRITAAEDANNNVWWCTLQIILRYRLCVKADNAYRYALYELVPTVKPQVSMDIKLYANLAEGTTSADPVAAAAAQAKAVPSSPVDGQWTTLTSRSSKPELDGGLVDTRVVLFKDQLFICKRTLFNGPSERSIDKTCLFDSLEPGKSYFSTEYKYLQAGDPVEQSFFQKAKSSVWGWFSNPFNPTSVVDYNYTRPPSPLPGVHQISFDMARGAGATDIVATAVMDKLAWLKLSQEDQCEKLTVQGQCVEASDTNCWTSSSPAPDPSSTSSAGPVRLDLRLPLSTVTGTIYLASSFKSASIVVKCPVNCTIGWTGYNSAEIFAYSEPGCTILEDLTNATVGVGSGSLNLSKLDPGQTHTVRVRTNDAADTCQLMPTISASDQLQNNVDRNVSVNVTMVDLARDGSKCKKAAAGKWWATLFSPCHLQENLLRAIVLPLATALTTFLMFLAVLTPPEAAVNCGILCCTVIAVLVEMFVIFPILMYTHLGIVSLFLGAALFRWAARTARQIALEDAERKEAEQVAQVAGLDSARGPLSRPDSAATPDARFLEGLPSNASRGEPSESGASMYGEAEVDYAEQTSHRLDEEPALRERISRERRSRDAGLREQRSQQQRQSSYWTTRP
uniref:Predicted protein n=1 Tax=Hordeum vulgare subsp. vulgare TaxID=112509 RepID=F2EJJ9_HORVV|nr:predicted protein [Hordeum vulgare subsp. vulgare]